MANLYQLSYARWNNNIKVRRNRKELQEHYRTADEQGSLPIFSDNSVAIPPLYAVKIIQAKNIF